MPSPGEIGGFQNRSDVNLEVMKLLVSEDVATDPAGLPPGARKMTGLLGYVEGRGFRVWGLRA